MNPLQQLIAGMQASSEIADFADAVGLVVVVFDPETNQTTIMGPFPKDTPEAVEKAQRAQEWMQTLGECPEVTYKVLPLFPTEWLAKK